MLTVVKMVIGLVNFYIFVMKKLSPGFDRKNIVSRINLRIFIDNKFKLKDDIKVLGSKGKPC